MRSNGEEKELPSDKIQKIYEVNPSYILDIIRKEDKNDKRSQSMNPKQEINQKENVKSDKNFSSKEITYNSFEDIFEKKDNDDSNNLDNTLTDNSKYNNISVNDIPNKFISNFPIKILNKKKLDELPQNNENINNNTNSLDNYSNNYTYNLNNIVNSGKSIKNSNLFGDNQKQIKYTSPLNILNKLKTYWGSINLQKKIYYLDNQEIAFLLYNILPCISEIMILEYGNYFFQKFIKKLNVQQKLKIYQIIEPNIINIALNKNGTHSIQSLIDTIESPFEKLALDYLLNKDMLSLFNDKNAYHIIMKIIIEKPEKERNNINLFIINNIEKIIINPYGSYCVNKYIANNIDLNMRSIFIKSIKNHINIMFFNKNSCSILFLMLKYFGYNYCEFIFQEMKDNLCNLIDNPFSNIFVHKLFMYLNNNNIYVLNSFIWDIYKNDNILKTLSSSVYGDKFLKYLLNFSNYSQKKYLKEKMEYINK